MIIEVIARLLITAVVISIIALITIPLLGWPTEPVFWITSGVASFLLSYVWKAIIEKVVNYGHNG